VRLIQSTKDRLVFRLGPQEKDLFLEVLKLYPRIPPVHHKLSKSQDLPDAQANQLLLDEALAEQRQENRKRLQALLAAPDRFRQTQTGCEMSLSPFDFEWLLQVLNDIRVGSWVRLGAPEQQIEELNEKTAADVWAMELAGLFQMQLLAGRGTRDERKSG
jgi:hypothetical protein